MTGRGRRDLARSPSDRYRELAIDPRADTRASEGSGSLEDRIIRAKYLDWCSARLAERFLELTPDEIYELAQQASHAPGTERGGASLLEAAAQDPPEPIASFRAIVARVTDVLAERMPLPTFEEWEVGYRAAPSRYEAELLGLWKE